MTFAEPQSRPGRVLPPIPAPVPGPSRRVVVGLSGGVDSAVAALLLTRQGHRVQGLFMKNWEEDDNSEWCSAAADLGAAEAVCERLGIVLHRANFSHDFWEEVFTHFLEEHRAGRTPNPDVLCNRQIKFGRFLDHALSLGAERIATGHYARIVHRGNLWRLLRAVDRQKDQTYFLHALDQSQLKCALFPLGALPKREVRRLAAEAGLPNHDRKDSTGICFIGERDFRAFLARYLPVQPGPVETPEGSVIGSHQGVAFYTLGQRQGLGIGGQRSARQAPWYVVEKDVARNALIVAQDHGHPLLMSRGLEVARMHWVAGAPPPSPLRCTAQARYRQQDQPCVATDIGGGAYRVEFDVAQRAVTPGQSVVLYREDECLGGGVIERTFGNDGRAA